VKHKRLDESGFLPLLLTVLFVVAAVVYLVYNRVIAAAK
jgi:hypothetical protein